MAMAELQTRTTQGPLGALPGLSYWQRRLTEECARADRYAHAFLLVLLELRGADASAEPPPPAAGVMAVAASSLLLALRSSDVLCLLAFNRFGLLLLEAGAGSERPLLQRLQRLIQREVAQQLPGVELPVLALGSARFGRDGSSPAQLLQAAHAGLRQPGGPDAADPREAPPDAEPEPPAMPRPRAGDKSGGEWGPPMQADAVHHPTLSEQLSGLAAQLATLATMVRELEWQQEEREGTLRLTLANLMALAANVRGVVGDPAPVPEPPAAPHAAPGYPAWSAGIPRDAAPIDSLAFAALSAGHRAEPNTGRAFDSA